METTIYKPSIYKGAGIYKIGAEGGGGGGYETRFETIKGKIYKIVKIGNYWWTCENLNYIPDNIPLRNLSEWDYSWLVSQAAYYDDDLENANKLKLGALYSYGAVLSLRNDDLDGWRIPSKTEWDNLISNSYTQSAAGVIMKSKDNLELNFPIGWNGINYNEMDVVPSGILDDLNGVKRYSQKGTYGYFWLYNTNSSAYRIMFDNGPSTSYLYVSNEGTGRSIRLCKDV